MISTQVQPLLDEVVVLHCINGANKAGNPFCGFLRHETWILVNLAAIEIYFIFMLFHFPPQYTSPHNGSSTCLLVFTACASPHYFLHRVPPTCDITALGARKCTVGP